MATSSCKGCCCLAGHTKEQQQGLCQASGRCSVSPATQIEPSVAAVVLPIHGGTPQHSADAARGLSPILAAFCSSMIVVTSDGSLYRPSAVPLPLGESAAGTAAAEPAPTVLQHSIAWAGDAAAALNAAADAAHSSGATWMFVVRAGDQVILQDAAAVLRELQASCKSEQLLACHKTASDPEAQVRPGTLGQLLQHVGPVSGGSAAALAYQTAQQADKCPHAHQTYCALPLCILHLQPYLPPHNVFCC